MSTSIYNDDGGFFVARLASTCERCGHRGRCMQFGFVCREPTTTHTHTHTLCLECFSLIAHAIGLERSVMG